MGRSGGGLQPLKELRASLLADSSLNGPEWCGLYCSTVDAWLGAVFERATVAEPAGLALLAVGGHGRRVLAPASDVDLLLVHDGKRRVKEMADALWYPIWDSGVPLDHSVRTPKEVRAAMDADIKVALGLLDARLVAGDDKLGRSVVDRALELWVTRLGKWLPAVDSVTRERHARFGDLAFLLEPDLKESRGGLRDVQLLRSLSQVVPVLAGMVLDPALGRAERLLTSARVELQRSSATNVLRLQDQDQVAEALGFADADALMAGVSGAARSIAWTCDDAWRRVASWLSGPKGRTAAGDRLLEPGIVLRDGEVALAAGIDPAADASLPLRVAAASAELDKPIARSALERLAKRALAPEGVWPPEALRALLRLLGAGEPAISAIEALDQQGVWLRYLPEWGPVRNRPQRNAYHRYTVDRHLLETVARAVAAQSAVARPDLLLLGAFLHDIGKGREGDHTEIGVEVAGALAARLGLPPADVEVVRNLVRHHLLLPDTATRRDLDDPATATAVAASVGDMGTLELLSALTEADSLATGPAAWGSWKAGLVGRLVQLTAATLEGRPPAGTAPELDPEQRAILASGRLEVLADGSRLTVAAPDHPGLLAAVAGVLTLSGVTVRSASTTSDDPSGMALLNFEVAPAFGELPDWDRFSGKLAAALEGRLLLDQLLEDREANYDRLRRPTTARPPLVRVSLDNCASARATILEVRAPDREALLYRITRALASAGVTIKAALVSTLGAEAVDVFYVQTLDGGKLEDPEAQCRVRDTVAASLDAAATAGA